MGRVKRQIPKGTFRLLTKSKEIDKGKLYPIYMEYNWNGNVIRKSTDIKCKVSDWNTDANLGRGELRPSFGSEYKRINNSLTKQLDTIDANLVEYNEKHPNQISSDVIKGFLQNKPLTRKDEGRDFVEFAKEQLKIEYTRNSIGYSRYKNGLSALNILGEFLVSNGLGTHKPDGIYLGEICCELLAKMIQWRRDVKKNTDETINHALTPILKACESACGMGFIDHITNKALQDMRIIIKPSLNEDEKAFDDKFLSKEQLKMLSNAYKNCKEPRRKEYIEMFLFAFHACGLRVVDIMTLQWTSINFEKRELRKILVKTKNRHTIPLTPSAIKILEKWKAMGRRKRFVFDLVPDDINLNDDELLYKVRNSATKSIDQSLIVVGEQLKFPFALTMHVARHTFAINALNDGLTMTMVSQLLGHGSTDITERVYAKFLPETLADEVAKLGYNFLPELDC